MDEELLNRNKNINRGFRKLEVWKEAIDLFAFVKEKITENKSISFKVKAQIEDSILSCSSNIAEGYGRRYLKENIQHINIALASLCENYSQIFALQNIGVIDKNWFDDYDNKLYSLENKLIQFNRSMIQRIDKEVWNSDYILRETIEKYNSTGQ